MAALSQQILVSNTVQELIRLVLGLFLSLTHQLAGFAQSCSQGRRGGAAGHTPAVFLQILPRDLTKALNRNPPSYSPETLPLPKTPLQCKNKSLQLSPSSLCPLYPSPHLPFQAKTCHFNFCSPSHWLAAMGSRVPLGFPGTPLACSLSPPPHQEAQAYTESGNIAI